MKYISILFFSSFLFLTHCKNGEKENSIQQAATQTGNVSIEYKPGTIINSLICQKNTSVNYSLYLPKAYTKEKKYPVIFFFDAHAKGSEPLKLYSPLADKYEFIFVGSNNSKNGLDNQTLGEIISATMNDAMGKFSIEVNQIYTAGFSGGAKVASIAAFGSPQIKGVIACAAAMPVEFLSRPLSFNYIGIAGLEDFNYRELAVQEQKLNTIKHELFVFDGKHEWAPAKIMDKALRKMITYAMEEGRITKDLNFITETNKLLKDSLLHVSYSASQQAQEEKLQQQLMNSLGEDTYDWWKKEAGNLHKKADEKNNASFIYKRILNYLSMACYTYVNKCLMQNQPEAAYHYTAVYELIDPGNADMFYFKALLFARQGKNQETMEALKLSADNGFEDIEKLRAEPSFKNIRDAELFEEAVNKIMENISQ